MKPLLVLLLCLVFCGCVSMSVEQQQAVRNGYVNTHSYLPSNIKEAIAKGQITGGMTREDVMASWYPDGMVDMLFKYPISQNCNAYSCLKTYKVGNYYFNFVNDKLDNWSQIGY